jgi:hypothetical protein
VIAVALRDSHQIWRRSGRYVNANRICYSTSRLRYQ